MAPGDTNIIANYNNNQVRESSTINTVSSSSNNGSIYQTNRFDLHESRLDLLLTTVQNAITNREGIFRNGLQALLPQYNMPPSLGIDKQTKICENSLDTAKYLWLRVQCDRRELSYRVNAMIKRAWITPKTNFLFHYDQLIQHQAQEISELFLNEVRYGFLEKDANRPNEKNLTGVTLIRNAKLMLEKYDGDPRKIIDGIDTHLAWEHLQEFDYWAEGLASLYLNEMVDLGIVQPLNTDKFMPKIDIHKPRVVFNVNAATLKPGFNEVFHNSLIDNLGPAYRDAAKRTGINMIEVDGGIWAIGANICSANDYQRCRRLCPLVDICEGNAKEGRREKLDASPDMRKNRSAGTLVINNEDGTRLDRRKHKNNIGDLFPHVHNQRAEPVIVSKIPAPPLQENQSTQVQLELF